ncbi:MAG: hemolysin family protein [Acidimicrobiia bacterium]|nr:hemolysin family protein [Acidimicrobiia bacterium]
MTATIGPFFGGIIAAGFFTSVALPIVVVLLLVMVNGVFVAAEFALVGSRRSRFEEAARNGNRAARWLIGVFDNPTGRDGYIAVAQLGITLASIGLGMYGEPAIAHWMYGPFENLGLSEGWAHTVGFLIALAIITYLHVVFGEMIPKALALQSPERTSLRVNPIMRPFGLVFRPAVLVLNWLALSLMRLLRIPEPDLAVSLYSSEELAIVTEESTQEGQLGHLQGEIIRNIFELEDLTTAEIMTSRSHIRAIDLQTDREEISQRVLGSETSRYPVYDGDLDHVVGLLHIKDFVRATQTGGPIELGKLVRRLPTVPGSTKADVLLERFKNERVHASLVVDELGSTIGFVTLDDIISEVIDDPSGDHDLPAVIHDEHSATLDGETTLTELEEDYGFVLSHSDVTTLAGLVLAETGVVPDKGTRVEVQGHELEVIGTTGMKITQVKITRPPPEGGNEVVGEDSSEAGLDH